LEERKFIATTLTGKKFAVLVVLELAPRMLRRR
jgi:hypothetical protein